MESLKDRSRRTCGTDANGSSLVSSPLSVARPPHFTTLAEAASVSCVAALGVTATVALGGPVFVAASRARISKKYSDPLSRPATVHDRAAPSTSATATWCGV